MRFVSARTKRRPRTDLSFSKYEATSPVTGRLNWRGGTRRSIVRPLRDFLATEAAGGVAVVLAAVAALIWANSPWSGSYRSLWATDLGVRLGRYGFSLDLRHWVNDGLMTAFFLVVGLEIKRELVEGELRERRKAFVPVAAAVGGMAVPALIFVAWNLGTAQVRGWGIPMATDIALAVGILALAGPRFPAGAKLFLLALAIVDDIGAIVVIAVFYGSGGRRELLVVAALIVVCVVAIRRAGVTAIGAYVCLGAVLWWALYQAGVHPTLAGVALGLLAPTQPFTPIELVDRDELVDVSDVGHAVETVRLAKSSVSIVEWLEHRLHPWTSFAVVPIFAIANAGVEISGKSLGGAAGSRVAWGVGLGLLVGKPLGIMAATYIVVRLGAGALPDGTTWRDLTATAFVAGVGFTVSLFVTELALVEPHADTAKIAILVASVVAGTIGLIAARNSSGNVPDP